MGVASSAVPSPSSPQPSPHRRPGKPRHLPRRAAEICGLVAGLRKRCKTPARLGMDAFLHFNSHQAKAGHINQQIDLGTVAAAVETELRLE